MPTAVKATAQQRKNLCGGLAAAEGCKFGRRAA